MTMNNKARAFVDASVALTETMAKTLQTECMEGAVIAALEAGSRLRLQIDFGPEPEIVLALADTQGAVHPLLTIPGRMPTAQ